MSLSGPASLSPPGHGRGLAPASRRRDTCRSHAPGIRGRRRRPPCHHPRARRSQPAGAVEDPDRAGGDVIAGTLPIADDVGFLDDDFADVNQLSRGYDGRNRRLVATRRARFVRPGGSSTLRIEAERLPRPNGPRDPGGEWKRRRNLPTNPLFLSLGERMFGGIGYTPATLEQQLIASEARTPGFGFQVEILEELDCRQVATADGCRSLSEWATARLDLHPDTAKTLVRTMRRTSDRPELRDELARGEISFDRLEALSRISEDVGLLEHLDVAGVRAKQPRGSGSPPKTNTGPLLTSSSSCSPPLTNRGGNCGVGSTEQPEPSLTRQSPRRQTIYPFSPTAPAETPHGGKPWPWPNSASATIPHPPN